MRIALLGTDGLPARYGGFETCVERLAPLLYRAGHDVLVIGSSVGRHTLVSDISGIRVRYLKIPANGALSILYDGLSLLRILRGVDVALLFGVSGGIWLPFVRLLSPDLRIILNVDGLDSQRSKWRAGPRRFIAASELIAVRAAHAIVSDNAGIADRVQQQYGRHSRVIAYGNDHVRFVDATVARQLTTNLIGSYATPFFLTIARAEPENMLAEMIEGFLASTRDMYVIISNFDSTEYGRKLKDVYAANSRIRLVSAQYGPDTLAAFRQQCGAYLHGHSVGGTNPSLIEMLPYAKPIIAFDCVYNRWTLDDSAGYFRTSHDLTTRLEEADLSCFLPSADVRSSSKYAWSEIAAEYMALLKTRPSAQ